MHQLNPFQVQAVLYLMRVRFPLYRLYLFIDPPFIPRLDMCPDISLLQPGISASECLVDLIW